MEPKEYVMERLKAPLVAPRGKPPGFCEQKYHEPYTPDMVTCITFLITSEIHYMSKVMNTSSPMTVAVPQLDTEQAGLLQGSYFA